MQSRANFRLGDKVLALEDIYRAFVVKIKTQPGRNVVMDYELLIGLSKAEKPASYRYLYNYISSTKSPTSYLSYFYDALDRLIAKGYAEEITGGKYAKRWRITNAGRNKLERLKREAENSLLLE